LIAGLERKLVQGDKALVAQCRLRRFPRGQAPRRPATLTSFTAKLVSPFWGMTNGTATPSSSDTFSRISRSVRSRTPTI
jgi:hypothetical protein